MYYNYIDGTHDRRTANIHNIIITSLLDSAYFINLIHTGICGNIAIKIFQHSNYYKIVLINASVYIYDIPTSNNNV